MLLSAAADATLGKQVTVSGGVNGSLAADASTSSCTSVAAVAGTSGAWLTADLGYVGQLAAVGLTLGATDLSVLKLRAGSQVRYRV